MYAVTAVAVDGRGEPQYFLIRPMAAIDIDAALASHANDGVVYNEAELLDFLDTHGRIVAWQAGHAPHRLAARQGPDGRRRIVSIEGTAETNALRSLPRFAFVNELTSDDLHRLYAINGSRFQPPPELPDAAVERYVDFGWVRRGDRGLELTDLGRSLLSYV